MIRFLLLGYGHIGKRHATLIEVHPEARLEGTIDVDKGKWINKKPFFTSLEEFLTSGGQADVAVIALPNGLHLPMAKKAVRAGMHVLIEKPMGLSSSSCGELIELAKDLNRQVFVVKQNRYSPPSIWMKEVLESGQLGKIFEVHIRCFWNRDKRYYQVGPKSEINWRGTKELDGGVLFTQFSHFIDVMYWVFGDIQNIQTRLFNHNHTDSTEFADSGMVHFEFRNGGVGSIQFSTSVFEENMESSMTVLAENGAFKIGGQYMDRIEFAHIKDYNVPEIKESLPPNDYGGYKGSAGNHAFVIQNVIDVLKHNAPIATRGEDGMKVVEIIEKIYAAAE
ncbi:MAG: gfo/Idh/MocA family oxidoreductase [Bacteroidetes bacterium]|nr:gfo/Idh/MocA family oxidoreductase [Bacteroidota bacterium]